MPFGARVGRHFHVRLDASAFPIGLGDWIYGTAPRNAYGEVFAKAVWGQRVSAAAGSFAD
jgi:hypothetical protein